MRTTVHHESAPDHVQGLSPYVDDLPEVEGTLYAAPILAPVAHAQLLGLNSVAALATPSVLGVVTHADIAGGKMLAAFTHDEPVFAMDRIEYQGQVLGLVLARNIHSARQAAKQVQVQYRALPAILTVEQALTVQSYVLPPVYLTRGDAATALKTAAHQLESSFAAGGQEHFYLEGQIAYALPQAQNEYLIHSSTQHPSEVQHWVAHALDVPMHQIQVQCRRMGGGFGGKETQAGHLAVWAALAAKRFQAPVKLRLDRDDDFRITGKRHPFHYQYRVGFDDSGCLCGLDLRMLANCGFSADLSGPVADRAIFHADNAYFLEHVRIASYRLKTHLQSQTAFRGFGGPQGMLVIETIMGAIARHLNLDPLQVRKRNFYQTQTRNTTHYQMPVQDNILLPLVEQLENSARYHARKAEVAAFNAANSVLKKGLALTPVKFGISFTATLFNQAGALVHVYTDGSVLVHHGGTEMGQGLNTKVAQIVAQELGLSVTQVRSSSADTAKIPNSSATAASAGTDLNGRAAQFAAHHVRENLAAFVAGLDHCGADAVQFANSRVHSPNRSRSFVEVVGMAYANRIQLWSDGFYRTPKIHYDKNTLSGRPFYYFAYGAACTEVAIDTLTGQTRVLAVDILHDVGTPINRALDIGQIEGGFIQGMGWLSSEELVWDAEGALRTHAPSTYKIPALGNLPERFTVNLWHQSNPEDNVGGSKAVGEPPFMLAISVWEALRDAIAQARGDNLVQLDAPATPERIFWALQHLK